MSQIHHSLRWPHRTFLERKEWLEVPWALNTSRKSPISLFNDVCCSVPGLCKDLNDLKKAAAAREFDERMHRTRIFDFIARTISRLEKIESSSNVLMGMSPQASWPGLTGSDITKYPQHLFGQPLQFLGLHGCADYLYYNFMCYILSHLLQQAGDELGILDPTPISSDSNTQRRPDPGHFADNLCRCVPYMCNFALHGSAGGMMMQHVLIDIFPCYGVDTEESRWIVSVFQIFWQELGLEGGNKFLGKPPGQERLVESVEAS